MLHLFSQNSQNHQNLFPGLGKPANWRLSGGDTVVEPLMFFFCFASFEGFVT
jgi:hypothetical protein